MGNIQSNRNLGLECVGLITRVGANAKPDFHIGDRVLCWFPGSLASHIKLDARYCIKLPDDISTSQAVTLSTAHAALFRGLVQLCSLTDSETILINSTDEPKCTAAIQIAQMIGAEVRWFLISREWLLMVSPRYLQLLLARSKECCYNKSMEFHNLMSSLQPMILAFAVSYRARMAEE